MTTTNIRISRTTHDQLQRISVKEGLSLRETVEMLIDRFGKDVFEEQKAPPPNNLKGPLPFDDANGNDKR